MKRIKLLGLAVAALVMTAFVGTASATTLTTNGVKQTGIVEMRWSLRSPLVFTDTVNTFANTCSISIVAVADATAVTGSRAIGPVSSMSFSSCTHEKVVVDNKGSLSFEVIGSGPNGTVRSSGMEVTVPATIGSSIITVNCKTSETDIGTLTGTAAGGASIDVNAVLNCGFFLPSARWQAPFVSTKSTGGEHAVGVVS
jgi:hypothetical protein